MTTPQFDPKGLEAAENALSWQEPYLNDEERKHFALRVLTAYFGAIEPVAFEAEWTDYADRTHRHLSCFRQEAVTEMGRRGRIRALYPGSPKEVGTRAEQIRKKLDILNGKGPGGKLNYAYADGYFRVAIEKEFGASIEELRKEIASEEAKSDD